jgi:hypothetical protein
VTIRRFKLIKQGLDDGAVLSDLDDVASTAPTSGQTIVWNGTSWVPGSHNDLAGLATGDPHTLYVLKTATVGDITARTADTAPDGATDYVITYDFSASAAKKALIKDLPGASITKGASWSNTTALVAASCADTNVHCERGGTIRSVTVVGDAAGSCVIDIYRAARASLPHDSGDSIVGAGTKPTCVSARSYRDTTMASWNLSITAGDVLTFHVVSVSTFTQLSIVLDILELGAVA